MEDQRLSTPIPVPQKPGVWSEMTPSQRRSYKTQMKQYHRTIKSRGEDARRVLNQTAQDTLHAQ